MKIYRDIFNNGYVKVGLVELSIYKKEIFMPLLNQFIHDFSTKQHFVEESGVEVKLLFCKKTCHPIQFGHVVPLYDGVVYFYDLTFPKNELSDENFVEITEENIDTVNLLRKSIFDKLTWTTPHSTGYIGYDLRGVYRHERERITTQGITPIYDAHFHSLSINPIFFGRLNKEMDVARIEMVYSIACAMGVTMFYKELCELKESEFKRFIIDTMTIDNYI